MTDVDWAAADAMALAVLAQGGGVARIGAFLAAGLSRHQVAAIFRRGVMHRPRIAWYADPALPWQARHAIRVGGILTCVSAAAAIGIPVPPGAWRRIHVHVPENSPRRRHNRDRTRPVRAGEDEEVELHWARLVEPSGAWCTGIVDTLLHLAHCVSEDWLVAALDGSLRRTRDREPLLSPEAWGRFRLELPRRLRRVLDLIDPRAESPLETLLRLAMIRRGIGPITPQFSPMAGRFVDFLIGTRLIVEVDGAAYHDEEADRIRDAAFRRIGYSVLRFSSDRILHDMEAVLDEIEAAFTA